VGAAVAAGSDPGVVRARRLRRLPPALYLLPALRLLRELRLLLVDVRVDLRPVRAAAI